MQTSMRYLRAFFLALKMTLRGQTLPAPPQSPIAVWTAQTPALIDAVYIAANAQGLDQDARRKIILHIDSRDINVETTLAAIKHHAITEYPYLLRHPNEHSFTAICATNHNDRYLALRLRQADSLQAPPLQAALKQLESHLEAIPTSSSPDE